MSALADRLADVGLDYPYRLAPRPNSGVPTGVDLDGNGRLGEARDAHGFGWFNGQDGIALLSRWPIDEGGLRDFSDLLWTDLPGNSAASVLPEDALPILRLTSTAFWDVPITLPDGTRFHVLATHVTPPVFDGPEDRNGHRNADEMRFWQAYLDGWSPDGPGLQAAHFALLGRLNVDPVRGEGHHDVLTALISHPRLQDPAPTSPGGGTATADWAEPSPGNLRVDYILPAAALTVVGQGVIWPEGEDGVIPLSVVEAASENRLVWVDLAF